MKTTIDLTPETEHRLDFLAQQTGGSKLEYLRKGIARGLEDFEDYCLAAEMLERIRKGLEKTHAAADVRMELGFAGSQT